MFFFVTVEIEESKQQYRNIVFPPPSLELTEVLVVYDNLDFVPRNENALTTRDM